MRTNTKRRPISLAIIYYVSVTEALPHLWQKEIRSEYMYSSYRVTYPHTNTFHCFPNRVITYLPSHSILWVLGTNPKKRLTLFCILSFPFLISQFRQSHLLKTKPILHFSFVCTLISTSLGNYLNVSHPNVYSRHVNETLNVIIWGPKETGRRH